jgi:hypothetical protein
MVRDRNPDAANRNLQGLSLPCPAPLGAFPSPATATGNKQKTPPENTGGVKEGCAILAID